MHWKPLCRLSVCLLLLGLFSQAKAGSPATPDQAAKEGLSRLQGKPFILGWVESSGAVADQTFIALSATKPSRQAKEFAKRISVGDVKEVVLVVSGPNSAKTKCVVADALKLQKKKLPKLTLCFIGEPDDEAEVAKRVMALDGKVPSGPTPVRGSP